MRPSDISDWHFEQIVSCNWRMMLTRHPLGLRQALVSRRSGPKCRATNPSSDPGNSSLARGNWREFMVGRPAIVAFLQRKWARELRLPPDQGALGVHRESHRRASPTNGMTTAATGSVPTASRAFDSAIVFEYQLDVSAAGVSSD
jgi:hypothetical protein